MRYLEKVFPESISWAVHLKRPHYQIRIVYVHHSPFDFRPVIIIMCNTFFGELTEDLE